jgi:hypothetical protein
MVHFSIFGGREGRLASRSCVYISVFGAASLRRPALAAQLAELKRRPTDEQVPRLYFFSIFGGASIRWPTLAEEYLALIEALRAGSLTLEEWGRSAVQADGEEPVRLSSFSIFGGISTDALPSEDQELDDLSVQRHAGQIPESAVQALMLAIGKTGAQRLIAVRQAALVALSPPA